MIYNWIKLPLYDNWDYEYSAPVNGVNLNFRIYYSDRTKLWSINLSYTDDADIVLGEALLPYRPIMLGAVDGVIGYLWLEEISSLTSDEAKANPDRIDKYYNLYYIYA